MLPNRRAFLPLCLSLGFLPILPALADTPPAPPAAASALQKIVLQKIVLQKIVLQHTLPAEIVRRLHWDQPANLPAGVTEIRVQPETNSLAVVATPAGFAKVQEVVKILDIAPRQVQIQLALAHAGTKYLRASGISFDLTPLTEPLSGTGADPMLTAYASGTPVVRLLQALTKRGAVTRLPLITTTNAVEAGISEFTDAPLQKAPVSTFAVTPRVNSDDSVTLVLHAVFADGAAKRELNTLRTVKSGDTLVIVLPPDAKGAGSSSPLLFVTPTILAGAALK